MDRRTEARADSRTKRLVDVRVETGVVALEQGQEDIVCTVDLAQQTKLEVGAWSLGHSKHRDPRTD